MNNESMPRTAHDGLPGDTFNASHKGYLYITPGIRGTSRNSRLSESAFTRYRSYIETAVNAWPAETQFVVPSGLSPNTFVARLRDALNALKQFRYDPTLAAKLDIVREADMVVSLSPDGSTVWFRARGKLGRPRAAVPTPVRHENPLLSAHESTARPLPSPSEIDADIRAARAAGQTLPLIYFGQLTAVDQAALEAVFDLGITFDPSSNLTTIIV